LGNLAEQDSGPVRPGARAADPFVVSTRLLAALGIVVAGLIGSNAVATADAETPAQEEPATASAGTAGPEAETAAGASFTGSTFGALSAPVRLLDSREGLGFWGKPGPNGAFTLPIAGHAGVPGNATAVVVNLTVTEPEGPGFVTAYPSGQGLPTASSANIEFAGQTVANLVTVPLGAGGAIDLYTVSRGHLVADVFGYYGPTGGQTKPGRLVSQTPLRILDTRQPNPVWSGPPLWPGAAVDVDVAGLAGLPRDARAAVLNLTITGVRAPGYFSLTPRGAPVGGVSNVNVDYVGQTVANQVIVPLTDGVATLYALADGHAVIDLAGWYTGDSAGSSSDGLFNPVTPGRLVDTRDPANSPLGGMKPGANRVLDVTVGGRRGVPSSGVAAVAVNATTTEANGPGFYTLWGAGTGQPLASNLNANFAHQTIANHAVVPVSTVGVSVLTTAGAHLLVDVAGYFTGSPQSANPGYTPNGGGGPPSSGPHTFLYALSGGGYARWNPCSTLTYVVNYNGAPSFARGEVDRAVARVEAATGIDLVNMGDTNAGNNGVPPNGIDAVIAFVNNSENSSIGNAAGLGGGSYYAPWNGRDAYVARGFVLINETINYSQGLSSTGLEGLLLHEIGHMMGLDHVGSTAEVMYPVMHNIPGGYGPGDQEGLWLLGAAQGCLNTGASGYSTQSGPGDGTSNPDGGPGPITVAQTQDGGPPPVLAYCSLGGDPTAHAAPAGSAPVTVMTATAMAPAAG
jgi:hypothetical protein